METKLVNGDYVPDGLGGVERLSGADALLGRETGANRLTAARQYVAEALAQEPVTVEDVTLTAAGEGRVHLAVFLKYQGTDLAVTLTV